MRKQNRTWKYYELFEYEGYVISDIKQGQINKHYFEFKLETPSKEILQRSGRYKNIENFKKGLKLDIKLGKFNK